MGSPFFWTWLSASTISRIRAKNQGSNFVTEWISVSLKPCRIACAIVRKRSGVCWLIALIIADLSGAPMMSTSSKPVRPVSIDASAFCKLSWMVRPIAMASPTDFIAVVRCGSDPGNFSNAKRGIFVTT